MFEWNPSPVIFSIGPLPIRWYSLSWLAAFVIGFRVFRWIKNREQRTEHDLESLFLHMLLGALIGARLGHCFFYHPSHYLANPEEAARAGCAAFLSKSSPADELLAAVRKAVAGGETRHRRRSSA